MSSYPTARVVFGILLPDPEDPVWALIDDAAERHGLEVVYYGHTTVEMYGALQANKAEWVWAVGDFDVEAFDSTRETEVEMTERIVAMCTELDFDIEGETPRWMILASYG